MCIDSKSKGQFVQAMMDLLKFLIVLHFLILFFVLTRVTSFMKPSWVLPEWLAISCSGSSLLCRGGMPWKKPWTLDQLDLGCQACSGCVTRGNAHHFSELQPRWFNSERHDLFHFNRLLWIWQVFMWGLAGAPQMVTIFVVNFCINCYWRTQTSLLIGMSSSNQLWIQWGKVLP